MEEKNIIICENCYEENNSKRKTCSNCGATLYYNPEIKKDMPNNEKKSEHNNANIIENNYYQNTVAKIIKILSFILGILGIIVGLTTIEDLQLMSIIIIVTSLISSILIYALGEIIQLLEDIKNK